MIKIVFFGLSNVYVFCNFVKLLYYFNHEYFSFVKAL